MGFVTYLRAIVVVGKKYEDVVSRSIVVHTLFCKLSTLTLFHVRDRDSILIYNSHLRTSIEEFMSKQAIWSTEFSMTIRASYLTYLLVIHWYNSAAHPPDLKLY